MYAVLLGIVYFAHYFNDFGYCGMIDIYGNYTNLNNDACVTCPFRYIILFHWLHMQYAYTQYRQACIVSRGIC